MGKFKFRSKVIGVKGFTLIELLVVISIIAVLLSILMPALNAAKERARTLICQTHSKSFSMANSLYANEYEGYSVDGWFWYGNPQFMRMLGLSLEETEEVIRLGGWKMLLPKRLLCPSGKVARFGLQPHPVLGSGIPLTLGSTYGFNLGNIVAHNSFQIKKEKIRLQASKVMFTDSSDFVINGEHDNYTNPTNGINYKVHWDVMGDYYDPWDAPQRHGVVTYRHSEGATIAFWDGHAETRKKWEMWIEDDSGSSDNSQMSRLWYLR